jgi:hypothetical protein
VSLHHKSLCDHSTFGNRSFINVLLLAWFWFTFVFAAGPWFSDHQLLAVMLVELESCVKPSAVGRHQINAFNLGHMSVIQQHGYQFRSKALALVLCGHHHIPKHGPIEAVAGGPAEADQGPTLPAADDGLAALKHLPEGFAAPPLGPKAVPIQQLLQLVQAPWL